MPLLIQGNHLFIDQVPEHSFQETGLCSCDFRKLSQRSRPLDQKGGYPEFDKSTNTLRRTICRDLCHQLEGRNGCRVFGRCGSWCCQFCNPCK